MTEGASPSSPSQAVIVSRRGALEMYGTLDVLGRGFPKGVSTPKVVGIAGATLLVAASVAALVPAWRTLRRDPLAALRYE